ncbi:hypothetical protein J2Z40_000771 [Cytobacillus eiseniae]|uniref:Uncharacterized protein n=1 Tax=Cytobacillus eiseniae TaxID=762947 RepID=A0ABS4RBX8_9BACI|nr:hypothetical protein [Cytobacillus eiseniae]MBP2240218.1 hypothetical protein [Cytobacillus eiseniae]
MKNNLKNVLIGILITLPIASITSFVLGYWKIGIAIGGAFVWLLQPISEYYSDKNREYLFSSYSKNKQSNNHNKYFD